MAEGGVLTAKTIITPGTTFGDWVVIGEAPKVPGKHAKMTCRCTLCDSTHDVRRDYLVGGKSKRCVKCKGQHWDRSGVVSRCGAVKFSSLNQAAAELGCCRQTMVKAIEQREVLRGRWWGWAAKG